MHINQVGMTRAHYSPGTADRIRMVVLHSTAGRYPGDYNWLRQGGSRAAPISIHYYISKHGSISQMVADKDIAWHAGQSTWVVDGKRIPYAVGCNPVSIGIELENLNDGRDPYPQPQYDAAVWLTRLLVSKYGVPRSQLVRHLDIAPRRKTDPAGFPWNTFANEVYDVPTPPQPQPEDYHWYEVVTPTPVRTAPRADAPIVAGDGEYEGQAGVMVLQTGHTIALLRVNNYYGHWDTALGFVAFDDVQAERGEWVITPQDSLFGAPVLTMEETITSIVKHNNGEYTPGDVATIVGYYYDRCARVGLDPVIVLAQCMHETAWLSSAWAARPHRNPAGIGVEGPPGVGLSFPSWDASSVAHIGRLLAYARTDTTLGPHGDAASYVCEALRVRPLPDRFRGVAARIEQFGNSVWAEDSRYAAKWARVANELIQGV